MSHKFVDIKEVPLKNNCPECYNNNGLRLTFKQKFIETKFYKSITQQVAHEIHCKTCNNIIYPVSWTDDIESVFEYHKKAFTPRASSLNLKRPMWIIIIALIIILLVAIIFTFFVEL